MLPFIHDKSQCVGCYACVSACPIHCISMKIDEEGFWYPFSSDQCIHCGKCEKVCPIHNAHINHNKFTQTAFFAVSKDNKVWKRSASGGAFSEICRNYADENTMIAGAIFDGLDVHHTTVIGYLNIQPLCKSKYVASRIEDTYEKIKTHLINGEKAIFCGTPCQVAGLKSFLEKDYDKLLLIDLICHGVGSPKIFQGCCDYLGEILGDKLIKYEFRAKRKVFESDYIQRIETKNHTIKFYRDDPYIKMFLSQNCLRPSCGENCIFRVQQRQGDITLADFKGLTQLFPKMTGTKKNYSSIIVNTEKGKNIVKNLSKNMKIESVSIDSIKKYNPLFYRQTWFSKNRDDFFKSYQIDQRKTIANYSNEMSEYKKTIKRDIYNSFPTFLRRFLLNLKGKKKNGKKQ